MRRLRHVDVEGKASTHAHLHEAQIRARQLNLPAEGRPGFAQVRQGSAQIDDQVAKHFTAARRIEFVQLAYLRERIEKKLRLDPRL